MLREALVFMAIPFSFCLDVDVFFKRETETPINQEARILDFVARLVVAKKFEHAHSVHFGAPYTHTFRLLYTMSPQGDFKISAHT